MPTEIAKCPKCKTELLNEIHEYFTTNCTNPFFDFKCSKCGVYMEVNAESVPLFSCSIPDRRFDTVGVGLLL